MSWVAWTLLGILIGIFVLCFALILFVEPTQEDYNKYGPSYMMKEVKDEDPSDGV